jgi:hypothetical protein
VAIDNVGGRSLRASDEETTGVLCALATRGCPFVARDGESRASDGGESDSLDGTPVVKVASNVRGDILVVVVHFPNRVVNGETASDFWRCARDYRFFNNIGGSGGPDLIGIVAAAGAPGAVVGEFLRGAEAGTDSITLTDGLGIGGGVLTRRDVGFAPDIAASRGKIGRPYLIPIVVAAGVPCAVVSELLTSAEAGIHIGAMVDGFGEGGGVDATRNVGFAPNRTFGISIPMGLCPTALGGVGAAAHFVVLGIRGHFGVSSVKRRAPLEVVAGCSLDEAGDGGVGAAAHFVDFVNVSRNWGVSVQVMLRRAPLNHVLSRGGFIGALTGTSVRLLIDIATVGQGSGGGHVRGDDDAGGVGAGEVARGGGGSEGDEEDGGTEHVAGDAAESAKLCSIPNPLQMFRRIVLQLDSRTTEQRAYI